MDTKAKIVIALVVILVLGEIAYIFLLSPSKGGPVNTGSIREADLQIPYRVVGYGDKLIFQGDFEPWMRNYSKNYYTSNNTTFVIIKGNITEFYNKLKGKAPKVLTYLVAVDIANHSYVDYLPLLPINTTIVLQGRFALRDGTVLASSQLTPVVKKQVIAVPYRLKKVEKTFYQYIFSFENRTKIENHSNICKNISGSVKQPYVTYLGPDYIIVNDSFTNVSQISKDYPGAICEPSVIISEVPLNISSDEVKNVYLVLLEPITGNYPTLEYKVSDINKTQYNVTMEVSKSGEAILSYIILEVK